MARIIKKDFVRTPSGGFNRTNVGAVTPTGSGVAVLDSENRMIYWHEEADAKKARAISRAIMDAVMDATPIDWASFDAKPQLEHKKEAEEESPMSTKVEKSTKTKAK